MTILLMRFILFKLFPFVWFFYLKILPNISQQNQTQSTQLIENNFKEKIKFELKTFPPTLKQAENPSNRYFSRHVSFAVYIASIIQSLNGCILLHTKPQKNVYKWVRCVTKPNKFFEIYFFLFNQPHHKFSVCHVRPIHTKTNNTLHNSIQIANKILKQVRYLIDSCQASKQR